MGPDQQDFEAVRLLIRPLVSETPSSQQVRPLRCPLSLPQMFHHIFGAADCWAVFISLTFMCL